MKFLGRSGRMLRACALALAVIILCAAFPVCSFRSSAESVTSGKVKIYHWKRVWKQSDIHDGRAMLMWSHDNTYYYTGGNNGVSASRFNCINVSVNPYIEGGTEQFYTLSDCDAFTLKVSGTDGDNDKMKKARFYRPDGMLLHTPENHVYWSSKVNDSHDQWTICTGEKNCNYADNTSNGYVQVIHNKSNADRYIDPKGSQFTVNECGSTWNTPDMLLYIATEEEYSAIGNYTVPSGSTLQIKDDAILTSGSTLVIEPGAVLSVEGQFYNNGVIKNYGTIVVEPNAFFSSIDPSDEYGGTVNCLGSSYQVTLSMNGETAKGEGNLLIFDNAKFVMPNNKAYLNMTSGTSCRNNGIMMISGDTYLVDAKLMNSPTGVTLLGHKLKKYFTTLYTYKNSDIVSDLKKYGINPISGANLICSDTQSYICKGLMYNGNVTVMGGSHLTYLDSLN